MKIKDIVKDDQIAHFDYYADGNLWYKVIAMQRSADVSWFHQEKELFKFPIPIDDTKGAIFMNKHKAITLMRWIRKHLDLIDSGGCQ